MKIALQVRRAPDLETLEHGHPFHLTRIFAGVRLQTASGWTEQHRAIIDTGSPYAVIPAPIWKSARSRPLFSSEIRGIVPGTSAAVKASFRMVQGILVDDRHTSVSLDIPALCPEISDLPFILGFCGVLDRGQLFVNTSRHIAWLRFTS